MTYIHNIPWPFLVMKQLAPEKVYVQKVWEAIIIAIVTAAVTSVANIYVTTQVIDTKLTFYSEKIQQNTDEIKDIRHDLYSPKTTHP